MQPQAEAWPLGATPTSPRGCPERRDPTSTSRPITQSLRDVGRLGGDSSGWGVTAQAALPMPQFPRCSALQVVEHPGLLGMGKPGGLVLPMATSELGGFRGGSNGNIPLGTHPCGGTHHCKRAMLQGGDGVGEAMCRVSRQHGGGPRKSPVGEKGKEEGKTTALLLAARMVCRHGDSTGDRRCSAAPSPRRGAGSAPCALSCILGIILLFFFSSSSTPGRALKPLHLWPGG